MTETAFRPDFPLPDLTEPLTSPFWLAAARDTLALPYCRTCARFRWYPKATCPGCGTDDLPWMEVPGTGTLFSWTVVRHAFLPAFSGQVPFVAALVTLDAAPGVRLPTRIVDAKPEELTMDAPVEVCFAPLSYPGVPGEVRAPFFRLRAMSDGNPT
ncbi:hypothetical protein GCM10023205_73180 [Yinghuangia aomiensis]|uniref:Uncharacterized protein n=1 Tax=Yinghuangia aomiensis TaxID=676205 RepID=A0ABP9I8R1_9ACTN